MDMERKGKSDDNPKEIYCWNINIYLCKLLHVARFCAVATLRILAANVGRIHIMKWRKINEYQM